MCIGTIMIIEITKESINKDFNEDVFNYLEHKGYEGFSIELYRPPVKEDGILDTFSGVIEPCLGQHHDFISGKFLWKSRNIFIIEISSITRGTSLVG